MSSAVGTGVSFRSAPDWPPCSGDTQCAGALAEVEPDERKGFLFSGQSAGGGAMPHEPSVSSGGSRGNHGVDTYTMSPLL